MLGHYTTYECAVHGLGDVSSLKKIRADIDAQYQVTLYRCPMLLYNAVIADCNADITN
jgi:hypothetical protein